MDMSVQQDLAFSYGRNVESLKTLVKGLSHKDTVVQPPFHANCMNWVLGHIAGSREGVLAMLGEKPLLTPEQAKRYGYGSEPVCEDGPDLIKLDEEMALIERSQERIAAALQRATQADLDKATKSFLGETTVGTMLLVMFGHECFHVGQVEMLRELALAKG
jgi:uncharacterized damage-inducible protein DinB